MKNLIISTLILLLVSGFGYAQSGRAGLTGPKAKNYKPFRNNNSIPGLEIEPKPRVMGPKAKNAKPWDEREEVIFGDNIEESDRPKLMGPKAKNYKPWRD